MMVYPDRGEKRKKTNYKLLTNLKKIFQKTKETYQEVSIWKVIYIVKGAFFVICF